MYLIIHSLGDTKKKKTWLIIYISKFHDTELSIKLKCTKWPQRKKKHMRNILVYTKQQACRQVKTLLKGRILDRVIFSSRSAFQGNVWLFAISWRLTSFLYLFLFQCQMWYKTSIHLLVAAKLSRYLIHLSRVQHYQVGLQWVKA